ncbi:hypothetical protein ABTM52_20265, partial [Acinetobacter baumannii]
MERRPPIIHLLFDSHGPPTRPNHRTRAASHREAGVPHTADNGMTFAKQWLLMFHRFLIAADRELI